MKEFQLIGKKSILTRSKKLVDYPSAHILGLPYEILLEILKQFENDNRTLLKLCLVCSKFQAIISKHFLYKKVRFGTPKTFLKFAMVHLPLTHSFVRRLVFSEPSNKINFIQSVEMVNPPSKEDANSKISIGGSYYVDNINIRSSKNTYNDFTTSFSYLLREAYGLKSISLFEISPSFAFPESLKESYHSSNHWKSKRPDRILNKLIMKVQTGWFIPLELSHFSSILNVFNTVEELTLHNFIINDSDLTFHSSSERRINIKKIIFHSCQYSGSSGTKRESSDLFAETSTLKLADIYSSDGLSLIDYIKSNQKLSKVIIDINSPVFFISGNGKRNFNFNKYNLFFSLLCSSRRSFSSVNHLVLENFDLFEQSQTGNDISNDESPLVQFWESVASISNLTIKLPDAPQKVKVCINCGLNKKEENKHLENLSSKEWSVLLLPLLAKNPNSTVTILTHTGQALFIRSKDT